MLPLTRTEEIILLAVCHLADEAYGTTIREYIEQVIGKKFSVGAIYVPLERLTDKGYLTAYTGDPTPERGGRSKRFYRVTTHGLSILNETKQLNDTLWANIRDLDVPQRTGVA